MKTAIDIHVHRNGEGRISFFPASIRWQKLGRRNRPCDIFVRVEGTPRFLFFLFFVDNSPFPMVVSKHSEDWPRKIETT